MNPPYSLLDWSAYGVGPSPLPDLDNRTGSGAWRIQHLASDTAPALALDLARRGATYLYRRGYAVNGKPAPASAISALAADVLAEASDDLRWRGEYDLRDDHRASTLALSRVLANTAREVRVGRAASLLLSALQPHLPSPSASAEIAATEYLATLDRLGSIDRPRLWCHYLEHGEPGGLSKSDLFALAAARWGQPRKLHGTYTFRTTRPTTKGTPHD